MGSWLPIIGSSDGRDLTVVLLQITNAQFQKALAVIIIDSRNDTFSSTFAGAKLARVHAAAEPIVS